MAAEQHSTPPAAQAGVSSKDISESKGVVAGKGADSGEQVDQATRAKNAEERSSCCSRWTLSWLNPLLRLGASRPLEEADLGNVATQDSSEVLHARFKELWAAEVDRASRRQTKPSLVRVLRQTTGTWPFVSSALMYVGYMITSLLMPLLLKRIVSHLEGSVESSTTALWIMVAGLMAAPLAGSVLQAKQAVITARLGVQMRTALTVELFDKALKLSAEGRRGASVGEITNVMSNDVQQLLRTTFFFNMVWSSPFHVAIALYLIFQEVGAATFAGVGFLVLLAPINVLLFVKLGSLRRATLRESDLRVKTVTEVLNGVKCLKFYGWSKPFSDLVTSIRERELGYLMKMATWGAVGFSFVLLSTPIIMPVITFAVFAHSDGELSASKAFTALALFNLMRFPFAFMPMGILQFIQAKIALKRVRTLLLRSEIAERPESPVEGASIAFVGATFDWNKESPNPADSESLQAKKRGRRGKGAPAAEEDAMAAEQRGAATAGRGENEGQLIDVNLAVAPGELVAVVGPVGCGKSTLCQAALGEVPHISGNFGLTGRTAYVSQSPFIMNNSLRENVLFGKPYEEYRERYELALRVAALGPDLEVLEGGDMCDIGERGINLSGGQKLRVALARAICADADVVILDDPLSAVDAHVGKHIFEEAILGALAGKTRLFVTHATHVLPRVDRVVVMDNGKIEAVGTLDELDARGIDVRKATVAGTEEDEDAESGDDDEAGDEGGSTRKGSSADVSDVALQTSPRGRSRSRSKSRARSSSQPTAKPAAPKSLIEAEERETGSVDWSVYWYYLRKAGFTAGVMMILFNVIMRICSVVAPFWLAEWSRQAVETPGGLSEEENFDMLNIYSLISMGGVLAVFIRSLLIAHMRISASRALHDDLLRSIMRAPMSFFDTTPVGRVINRFARDCDRIDLELPPTMAQLTGTIVNVTGALAAMVVATKGTFVVLLAPILAIYYYVQRWFRLSSTEIQRLESVSRSPIFTSFTESVMGAPSLRAYGQAPDRIVENKKRVDTNTQALQVLQFASQWLSIRLDIIGAAASCFIAAVAIATQEHAFVPAEWVAVGMAFSMEVTVFVKHAVRMLAQAEMQLNAVERLRHYAMNIESEAAEHVPGKIDGPWPQEGRIEFKHLNARYRDGPLVLKDINASVAAREKIGIIGRTGSGKSSLLVTLFRLIEPDAGSEITIDGVNILTMGLTDLRQRLAIIPQEPTLFSASLRFNVDPFNEYDDASINDALAHAQLGDLGIDAEVKEGGANFSQGQKQLICIARALLRKPRVLVLDEATASVDHDTDVLIQQMVREQFKDATVLTVAHRLDTIADSDRILVLSDGEVVEFDAPAELLRKPDGVYKGMVEASAQATAVADGAAAASTE